MHRRQFLKIAGMTSSLIPFTLSCRSSEKNKPNIILCMADDQGWGDAGFMGHPFVKTPHLDAMSGGFLNFSRFYAAAPGDHHRCSA